jgi:hypothetical protein
MFQRQYEDDADILADGQVMASGYARLELVMQDDTPMWSGTFRVTAPDEPPTLTGSRVLRLRDGATSEAQLDPTEDIRGDEAGRAGTFFAVTGLGPCPF